jgi:bud site selection protein 20
MGQPKCRKKQARAKNKQYKKGHATKSRSKDLDQIQDEIQLDLQGRLAKPFDADLPGMGQYRCMECARFFINERTLEEHRRSKFHKKMSRRVLDPIYTQGEAEQAAGMGPVQNNRND